MWRLPSRWPTTTSRVVAKLFHNATVGYANAASGAFVGINRISEGSATLLFGTGPGSSPYDFLFSNANTCHVTDDRALVNGGGLQKWILNSGVWSLAYRLNAGLTIGLRSVTIDPSTGKIYAVSAENQSKLVSITDSGADSSFTTLYTSTSNTALRGVEFVSVPTPSTFALLALGGLAMFRRRR